MNKQIKTAAIFLTVICAVVVGCHKVPQKQPADKTSSIASNEEYTSISLLSILQTMRVFNDAKIDLYNALYDQKYLASGPLIDHAYPVFLKEKYKTNDYYNAAVYSAASGSISSQKELKKYYSTTITADLKTRDEKIQTIQEALDKKKAVKNSIRIYRKDGRWVTPYPRCQLKVKGLMIVLFNI